MFGTYRLFLAVLVVVSHMKVRVLDVNPGVFAVIQFFIVSGYVMTALLDRHYPSVGRHTLWFYADRALRIVPQYLLFLGLTVLWAWWDPQYLRQPYTPAVLVAHVAILPLNVFPFWEALRSAFLLPQAASLALEEQFYLVFPWILRARAPLVLAGCASFIVFAMAAAGRLDPVLHTYVLPTGTLFIFLLGALLRRWSVGQVRGRLVVAAWLAVAALWLVLELKGKAGLGHNHAILAGLVVGVPVIAGLSRLAQNPADDAIGRASYGVFLGHMIVVSAARLWWGPDVGGFAVGTAVVVGSIALGWLGWWIVERPTTRLRYELRRRRGAA